MLAVIVSVDYADILAITLPYNRHRFDDIVVVTSTADTATQSIVRDNHCRAVVTDVFFENGASFNKFAAIEYAINIVRPRGWMCFLDADILVPIAFDTYTHTVGKIYSPFRRMWDDISKPAPPESQWHTLPYGEPTHPTRFAGYMQVFHTYDPVLRVRPWHRLNYANASDGDTEFSRKWPKVNKVRPTFDVLHLGQDTKNWCGRVTPYVDGTLPADVDVKAAAMRSFLHGRKHKKKAS